MTKNEFMGYLDFLEKLLEIKAPTDKEILQSWYLSFEKTHIDIAKKMARLYLEKETGFFKLAKLLGYKKVAMAGKEYKTTNSKCKYCGGTGWVQTVTTLKTYPSPFVSCKRCICSAGNSLSNRINQATQEELNNMDLISKKIFSEGVNKLKNEK